jgi:hypothetical protein
MGARTCVNSISSARCWARLSGGQSGSGGLHARTQAVDLACRDGFIARQAADAGVIGLGQSQRAAALATLACASARAAR